MTDASGTNTLRIISNVGKHLLYEIKNNDVDDGETIPFDSPSNSPVVAEDQVIVIGMYNETTEKTGGGGALSCEYDESNMHFTVTESGITTDVIRIQFYYLGQ